MRTLTQGPYSVRYKAVDYIGVSVKVGVRKAGVGGIPLYPQGGTRDFKW